MRFLFAFMMFGSALAWGFDFINPEEMSITMIRVSVGFTIFILIAMGIASLKGWLT